MIGPPSVDLDLFYTLPTALELRWEFEYAHLERDTFSLELVPDVHRDHGIRNAIVVVAPTDRRSDERYTRLALAHAWREGVRRFILVIAGGREPGAETAELEQELRVLLDALGDGGAAPCIRSALTRCAGRTDDGMRAAMERLLAEIERVFPAGDEDVVDAPLPAMFDREAAILDAVAPLVRSATMIGERSLLTLEETAALRDGTGGSHANGWPYLPRDEAWPTCPSCGRTISCLLQIDTRDALHAVPPAHRLFVIYRCERCYQRNTVIRHYANPTAAARRPIDPTAPVRDDPAVLVMERRAFHLPDGDLLEHFPEVVAALTTIDAEWGALYWTAESAMGMGSLRIPDHLGGWECSQSPRLPICACGARLVLVSSTQWGDFWNSLWACPEHPDVTDFAFHR